MTPSARYAREVVSYLERLPRRRRRSIEVELASELHDYPEAGDQTALEARLGPPLAYASELAEDLGILPGRRRRPHGRTWIGVGVVVAVATWLLLASVASPVAPGSSSGLGTFEGSYETDPVADWTLLVYQHGETGDLVWSLRNDGWAPVTIRDLNVFPSTPTDPNDDFASGGLLVQTDALFEAGPPAIYGRVDNPISFRETSLRIPAHEERQVVIRARFDNCSIYASGSGNVYSEALVSYSYLGMRRSARIVFPTTVINAPVVCPTGSTP